MASTRLRSSVEHPGVWTLVQVSARTRARRSAVDDGVLAMVDSRRVRVLEAFDAEPQKRKQRRTLARDTIDLSVAAKPGEQLVLMARYPSGAISFHVSDETVVAPRRRSTNLHFHVPAPHAPDSGVRRRGIGAAVRIFLLNAVAPLATRALTVLARNWETRTWQKSGKAEGWVRVRGNDEAMFALERVKLNAEELAAGPCLLLLHGTFSDSAGSFASLVRSGFLKSVRARYGDRIFAYEHFTVSRSPAENLRALLDALPAGSHTFDVIGYSRGALLCRMLQEQAAQLGPNGGRFALGRAVLIEGPLRGTPLARPARYRELLGWLANLLEMFPANPLTTAAAWLTDGIIWLAYRLSGALPGIAAMDPDGELLGELTRTAVPDERYFAIAADFQATQGMRARLLDVAADGFFAGANDLVVPTQGCYALGQAESSTIAQDRRIVFGNTLAGDDGLGGVHHLNAVGQSRTARFAADVLTAVVRRGAAAGRIPAGELSRAASGNHQAQSPRVAISVPAVSADPTFHILVLSKGGGGKPRPDMVLATWNGARVKQPFNWSESDARGAGERWSGIVAMHKRLLAYFSGEPGKELPDETALRRFGRLLFETLMAGEVGRLYDEARGQIGAARLIVVLTSDPESGRWAEKPWEFAFDPARRTWFATEDVHLIRDVLGAVPADMLPAHAPPLRLLVAYAQPIDAQSLSVGDERKVILRAFQPLIDAGLAQVDVLPRATPAALQERLESAQYDVLHFVGHGAFDEDKQRGMLLFEDDRHNSQLLYESQFRQIVANRGLRMVFLNACESGRGGYADFNRGVAPALLSVGIPAAVANQFSVFDSAAVSFAQNLYARLALGRTLAEAMREARIALNYSLDGTNIDWAVPILFTRVPSLRLCTAPANTAAADVLSKLPSVQRDTIPRRHRVGVWDVSRRFPGLEAVVERMNRAQGELEIVLVDASVPLAAGLITKKRSEGGTRYLNADAARSRLRRLPLELKLDLLVGFTHERMVSAKTTDVFAVWGADADGAENSVALFSVAGFDFPSSGEVADAFVINGLVSAIAGVLCGLGAHKDGERRCPLYYNARRELTLLVGRQRFDPRVRRAIKRKSPDLLTALDALLAKVAADAEKRVKPKRATARKQAAGG